MDVHATIRLVSREREEPLAGRGWELVIQTSRMIVKLTGLKFTPPAPPAVADAIKAV